MAYFLAKTDPDTYSLDDLKRDAKTEWDGVRNPAAVNAIKETKPGDTVIIYHTGDEKAVVGLAKVVSEPRLDKNDDRSWIADFEYVQHAKKAVTAARDQGIAPFRRLGARAHGPAEHDVRPGGVLGLAAETGRFLAPASDAQISLSFRAEQRGRKAEVEARNLSAAPIGTLHRHGCSRRMDARRRQTLARTLLVPLALRPRRPACSSGSPDRPLPSRHSARLRISTSDCTP